MTMYVGKRSIRVDAEDKVTGKAVYPDDIEFPDMVYAGVVRSSIPYGKVTDIDFEEAKDERCHKHNRLQHDTGRKTHGVVLKDQPMLVKDIVKRVGDPILVIAAENKKILKKAIESVKVEYEEYKGVFSVDDAIKSDAPILGDGSNILYDLKIKKAI